MTTELPEPMRCPECRAPAATPDARVCATHGLYLLDAAAMAQLDQAPLLGQVLDGKYALVGLVGGGGYGSVYRALQQPLGREVAVKVLHGLALTMKVARERFEREAQALSCLTSVHTVRLIDYGITREGQLGVRNLPYMVMELVEGEDLERRLRRGPLSASELLVVLDALADALDEAHAHGIMHRDLKPSNVLLALDRKGRVVPKVIDFGIARWSGAARSQTGFVTGTPAYMSPEQARGQQDLDGRVDVYALAAMTFELVSGRPPYTGDDAVAVLTQQCTAPIPRLGEVTTDAEVTRLEAPITRGLAKDRDQRPTTVSEFVAECRVALAGARSGPILGAATAKPSESSPPTRVGPLPVVPRATAIQASPLPRSESEPVAEPPQGPRMSTSDLARPVPASLRPRRIGPLTLALGGAVGALVVATWWGFSTRNGGSHAVEVPETHVAVEPPYASAPPTDAPTTPPTEAPPPPSTAPPTTAPTAPPSVASARRPAPALPSRAAALPPVDPGIGALVLELDAALNACRCGSATRLHEKLSALAGGRGPAQVRTPRVSACKPVDIDHKCVDGRLVEVQ